MKNIFRLFLLSMAFLTIQCADSDTDSGSQNLVVNQPILEAKKAEIIAYINSFDCAGSCNSIAFGSKPCGGPREYLLFSSAVDVTQLEQMVSEYNEMDHQYNIETNAISDCALVLPPDNLGCLDGNCVLID